MYVLLNEVYSGFNNITENIDPRNRGLPFVSPWQTIGLLCFYYYFVNHFGPRMMEKRQPVNMYYPLYIYNWIQIGVNLWIFLKVTITVWIINHYHPVCSFVDTSNSPFALEMAWYIWIGYMVKVLDLLDTVFMVLRKKSKQITFLHQYHHASMVVLGWVGAAYFPGGSIPMVLGTINTFIHTVMYSYYQLALVSNKYKNVWWKKYLTKLQMFQFVILVLHCLLVSQCPNNKYPNFLIGALAFQICVIFFLFLDFYRKAYTMTQKEKAK